MINIDNIIEESIKSSLQKGILDVATSYDSPVKNYIKNAFTNHEEKITKLLNISLDNLLKSKDFEKEMENVLVKKLSQSILSSAGSETQSVIDNLQRKNPVLKQQIEVAISKIISKYLKD